MKTMTCTIKNGKCFITHNIVCIINIVSRIYILCQPIAMDAELQPVWNTLLTARREAYSNTS